MGKTSIEWTEATWNPTRGCSRVSPGCERCYAEVMAARFSEEGLWGHGFAERGKNGGRWTRRLALVTDDAFPNHGKLDLPLHWKTPRVVFVNSTSDLFHESLTNEEIAAVFGVMAACPRHTFQVLTKRAKRMREWFEWLARESVTCNAGHGMPIIARCLVESQRLCDHKSLRRTDAILDRPEEHPWPLRNVHIGVSVESQEYADERIPELLHTPAAIRWVSYEPALGPVDFNRAAWGEGKPRGPLNIQARMVDPRGEAASWDHGFTPLRALDWIVCGGESGPGSRLFRFEWARGTRDACADANVPFFFKQAGSNAIDGSRVLHLKAKKGGDLLEIPEDLRVRHYPKAAA